MLIIIIYLVSQVISTFDYDGSKLVINEDQTISQDQVSPYKNAKILALYGYHPKIKAHTFKGFTSLQKIIIYAKNLHIESYAFEDSTALQNLTFYSDQFNPYPIEYTIYRLAFPDLPDLVCNFRGYDYMDHYSFLSDFKELNIDVENEVKFYDCARSNVKRIIIKGSIVEFAENSFFNRTGIDLLQIEANDVTFGYCSLILSGIKEIQCYSAVFVDFHQVSFGSTNQTKLMNITAGKNIIVQLEAFASAKIGEIYLKSKNVETTEMAFKETQEINILSIDTGNNFNTTHDMFSQANVHQIYIKCNGTCTFNPLWFKSIPDLQNLTIFAASDISFVGASFINSNVNTIILNTNGSIIFEQWCFEDTKNVTNFEMNSLNDIYFYEGSFMSARMNSMQINTKGIIHFDVYSLSSVHVLNQLQIYSDNDISFDSGSFYGLPINSLNIFTNGSLNFEQKSFKELPNLTDFSVHSFGNIVFDESSFENSNISSIKLCTNGNISFGENSFKGNGGIKKLEVHALDLIDFKMSSFEDSFINNISIFSNNIINFDSGSFTSCKNLNNLIIRSKSNITFNSYSFTGSEIKEFYIFNDDENHAIYLEDSSKITFNAKSFNECLNLTKINISSKGDIEIAEYAFQNNKILKNLNINSKGLITVRDFAFDGCDLLTNPNYDCNDTNISDHMYGDRTNNNNDNNNQKKKYGSSHKSNDEESESSAEILGDIDIKTVYLGASPNIYVNLNFLSHFMNKIRKTFGHIIPSPDLVHSAIWVGPKNANDNTLGAIFVYGKYFNKYKLSSYLNQDGAKAYVMKFGEFKERYPSIDPLKLELNRNMRLFDFIKEVKKSGKWRASDYNWPTNNCQHFTAQLIKILQAKRSNPNDDDWIYIPKTVLNSLKTNEN